MWIEGTKLQKREKGCYCTYPPHPNILQVFLWFQTDFHLKAPAAQRVSLSCLAVLIINLYLSVLELTTEMTLLLSVSKESSLFGGNVSMGGFIASVNCSWDTISAQYACSLFVESCWF